MTTLKTDSGLAASRRRPVTGRVPLLLIALLLAAPVMASTGLSGDSADQLRIDEPLSLGAMSAVDGPGFANERMLAVADVNQFIAVQGELFTAMPVERSGRIQSVLKRALALLGTPYRWGGESTEGFDCSGLVGYVFRSALGIELPRVSSDMASNGEKIDKTALNAGDLVFFSRRGKRVDHVGIYVGNGNFVHAPRSGRDVTVSSLVDGYWSAKFMQARRVPGV